MEYQGQNKCGNHSIVINKRAVGIKFNPSSMEKLWNKYILIIILMLKLKLLNGIRFSVNKANLDPIITSIASFGKYTPVSKRRRNNWSWFIIDHRFDNDEFENALKVVVINAWAPIVDFVAILIELTSYEEFCVHDPDETA